MQFRFPVLILTVSLILAFSACQDDIPVLGQEENGTITPKDSVFIRYIALVSYQPNDPSGNPWDPISSTTDLLDSLGPDVYYNSYNDRGTAADSSDDFVFNQDTHFANVTDSMLPLVYYFTTPVYVPHFYDSIYLRVYDFEIDTPYVDSTLMDSIFFVIGPDTNQSTNPYILSIPGTGFNGTQVQLGLGWK